MRILFDSRQQMHKDPFGTLVPEQTCALQIHVPSTVGAVEVSCRFQREDGTAAFSVPMTYAQTKGVYAIFRGEFHFAETGLYYYYFYVQKKDGGFRLFKQGDQTNMEAGECWQLSCIPAEFTTPDWAKGAVIYQLFPDRFYKSGDCDLTGKLTPYTVHTRWDEEVQWRPTATGEVLNNDFYGGNFRGITEKMEYIASLGVTILYLNPISKSFSSHRYDTGDYKQPDPMLGTTEEFSAMCQAAHSRGIRVVLDGVYSHTGSNSLYFNKNSTFPGVGAYNSPQSPYYSWYTFHSYPDSYNSWWNFDTLPTVNKMDPAFMEYIITGEDSVVAHWLALGADGFRLDVVDELPDEFVKALKERIRQIKPDALLIGEVWEDASNKVAYGKRRRYFVDGELDSCMNYPFRTAILDFMHRRDGGARLQETVMRILENYPPQVVSCNMNLLGTHDTPRILTSLVDEFDGPREALAERKLGSSQLETALERLEMAVFLQYMLPGAPSIYYADEAQMQGYKDPFNRRTYPWGRENGALLAYYRQLGQLRKQEKPLQLGDTRFFRAQQGQLGFCRSYAGRTLKIYVNRSEQAWEISTGAVLLGKGVRQVAPNWISLQPMGFCVIKEG